MPALAAPILQLPRWRERWQSWWLRRLTPSDDTTLTHRNVYILPTRAGWMLAITLLLLLVGSINYQLNLGYLLTFLLAGSAVIGMHVSHNNLRGLHLSVHAGDPVFAGQAAPVEIRIHNPLSRHRYGVGLDWWPGRSGRTSGTADGGAWADVSPRDSQTVRLALPTTRRGQVAVPAITVETLFPLGTFRVWHWWRPAATVWVYPAPETPCPPLPAQPTNDEGPLAAESSGMASDEVEGLRPYRRGDPLKWVAWKKVARQGPDHPNPWVSRDFSRPASGEWWLDTHQCGVHDTEGQCSRLCAWVLEAEQRGMRYGLRTPRIEIEPSQGPAHQRRCLEALACL